FAGEVKIAGHGFRLHLTAQAARNDVAAHCAQFADARAGLHLDVAADAVETQALTVEAYVDIAADAGRAQIATRARHADVGADCIEIQRRAVRHAQAQHRLLDAAARLLRVAHVDRQPLALPFDFEGLDVVTEFTGEVHLVGVPADDLDQPRK